MNNYLIKVIIFFVKKKKRSHLLEPALLYFASLVIRTTDIQVGRFFNDRFANKWFWNKERKKKNNIHNNIRGHTNNTLYSCVNTIKFIDIICTYVDVNRSRSSTYHLHR